ncbi:uncharacterized protein LOC132057694 [Lycium ferocissimum]|uniref:uncharacterized protein LOC132057694 n=1 Tax=Lycium ferocissimum TaxID=112874 RepID=UPI00281617DA|nr:uncharacterized protein LOC132057694 [Lycium ferocissimum]
MVSKIYSKVHHRCCTRHLTENARKEFHCGDFLGHFYHTTKAYCKDVFNDHFEETRYINAEVADYLENVGFRKWNRAYFPGNRYDVLTSNIAESVNSMFNKEREFPITALFNTINEDTFTITGESGVSMVDLRRKTCSCREFDLEKIPCSHAMAALRSKFGDEYGKMVFEYSSSYYKVELYVLAYTDPIFPVPAEEFWSPPLEILQRRIPPPEKKTKRGRKRMKRVPGVAEGFSKKKFNKCSLCKRFGHKKIHALQDEVVMQEQAVV